MFEVEVICMLHIDWYLKYPCLIESLLKMAWIIYKKWIKDENIFTLLYLVVLQSKSHNQPLKMHTKFGCGNKLFAELTRCCIIFAIWLFTTYLAWNYIIIGNLPILLDLGFAVIVIYFTLTISFSYFFLKFLLHFKT